MSAIRIPFFKPYRVGKELEYISNAAESKLNGDGYWTAKCNKWIQDNLQVDSALLTHSCTAALEMAVLLADLKEGDEVIMPSFTFVSTANAVVLRGAVPVFVDIRADTLNIDESKIEEALTSRTKAIIVVHYAGVSCEMDTIIKIARQNDLLLVEDAAQGILSTYNARPLGSIGDVGALSFHETKNISCGEGGAILINKKDFASRAEIIREKGTNRSSFLRGEKDFYQWLDIGSSYLPSELNAAFLFPQLESAFEICDERKRLWSNYYHLIMESDIEEFVTLPSIPSECDHNGHIFFLILRYGLSRSLLIEEMTKKGVELTAHYVPLHSSPAGSRYGKCADELPNTDYAAKKIIRLPMWLGLSELDQAYVVDSLKETLFLISSI